ncbi:MAG: hypothetical protein KDJ88_06210 [Bauldia sp.]|nr:hypothetical protein [Bauldia sp.]
MRALDLTRRDLIRALQPAIDGAVARRAEDLARRVVASGGVDADVSAPRDGACAITVSGPGLFAREFGSIDRAAEPVIAPAVAAGREQAP